MESRQSCKECANPCEYYAIDNLYGCHFFKPKMAEIFRQMTARIVANKTRLASIKLNTETNQLYYVEHWIDQNDRPQQQETYIEYINESIRVARRNNSDQFNSTWSGQLIAELEYDLFKEYTRSYNNLCIYDSIADGVLANNCQQMAQEYPYLFAEDNNKNDKTPTMRKTDSFLIRHMMREQQTKK